MNQRHTQLAQSPVTVTIQRAIADTGLGRTTLYRRINSGDLETVKVGKRTLIRYASLQRLLGVGGDA